MKAWKKLTVCLLALALVLSFGVAAFADGGASITITNARYDESYTAYKMFNLEGHDGNQYSYKVTAEWESFFAAGNPGEKYITLSDGYPTWKSGASESDFAKAAITWAETHADAISPAAGPTSTPKPAGAADDATYPLTFGNLSEGYYVVRTTLGALCSLNTAETNVEITDKNSVPTVDKEVKEGETWGKESTAQIGDTVEFQAFIKVGEGTKNYVFHDQMGNGLTYIPGSVQVNGSELTSDMVLTAPSTDGCTFEIAFADAYIMTLAKDSTIKVTYKATLNEQVDIEQGANNDAWLKYGENSSTTKVTTNTKVLTFDLVKYKDVDGQKSLLENAEFRLYDAKTSGNEIPLVKLADGSYRPAVAGEKGEVIRTVADKPIRIVGLDNKLYYLEETQAPRGFNKPTDRFEVDLTQGSKDAVAENGFYNGGVQILNNSGTLLPTTGGIGTTIFYVVGGILMAAAAVVLITKKRMEKNV